MTQSFDVIPMNTAIQARNDRPVSDAAALFISNELLPMMIGFWPKSANQINSNLIGNGIAYGLMLKGFSAKQIRDVVSELAEREPSREYAPAPQLLKHLCISAFSQPETKTFVAEISIRSLELQAQVKALRGEIADSEVSAHVRMLAGKAELQGYQVTGRAF